MFETIQETVARGAAWLDGVEPGWWDRVNLDTLHMESCKNCVLGQLGGDFRHELAKLRPEFVNQQYYHACLLTRAGRKFVDAHGFDVTDTTSYTYWTPEADKAWREEILKRRGSIVVKDGVTISVPAGTLEAGDRLCIRAHGIVIE